MSVSVLSPGQGSSRSSVDGVAVEYLALGAPPPFSHLEFQIKALRRVQASGLHPDVVHVHSEPEAAWLMASVPAAKVLSYDNYFFRRSRPQGFRFDRYRHLLTRFDVLLPCSCYCAEASRSFWRLGDHPTRVLYNGVNTTQFSPMPHLAHAERRRLGLERPVALYVGRLNEQKGTDVLIRAFASLRSANVDVDLVVVGPAADFSEPGSTHEREVMWSDRLSSIGAAYLGVVPDERLVALYNLADIFVLPTRSLEMFGMAAVEALACGVPVVTTDHGGLPETVPSTCGLRVPPGEHEPLANAITTLLAEDPAERAARSKRCREHAANFSWDHIASASREIYDQARVPRAPRGAG